MGRCGGNCPGDFEIVITPPTGYFRRQRGREGNYTGSRSEQSWAPLREAEEGLGAAVRAQVSTECAGAPAEPHLQPPWLHLQTQTQSWGWVGEAKRGAQSSFWLQGTSKSLGNLSHLRKRDISAIASQVQFLYGLVAQWLGNLTGCLGSESLLIVWKHNSGPRNTWL